MQYSLIDSKSLYNFACREVDAILTDPQFAATEGLNSSIFGRIFVSLSDTMRGLMSTFVTNITKINKSLKRSELHEFIDSNKMKVHVVDGITFDRLVGVKVDCPANMTGTFKQAVASVANLYTKLNAMSTAKMLDTVISNIFKSVTSGDGRAVSLINSSFNVIKGIVSATKPAIEDCQDRFSGKFFAKVPFESLFTDKDEWYESCFLLRELEPRLQEAREMNAIIETVEKTLKNVCLYMNDNADKLDKNSLMTFGEMIKSVALIFDGYNLAVTRQLALEHNYVLIINEIYSCVR